MNTYYVGQIVRIVDTPNMDPKVGWLPDMDQYCGLEARITDVEYDGMLRIDLDNGKWLWLDDCFQKLYDPVDDDFAQDDEEVATEMERLLNWLV